MTTITKQSRFAENKRSFDDNIRVRRVQKIRKRALLFLRLIKLSFLGLAAMVGPIFRKPDLFGYRVSGFIFLLSMTGLYLALPLQAVAEAKNYEPEIFTIEGNLYQGFSQKYRVDLIANEVYFHAKHLAPLEEIDCERLKDIEKTLRYLATSCLDGRASSCKSAYSLADSAYKSPIIAGSSGLHSDYAQTFSLTLPSQVQPSIPAGAIDSSAQQIEVHQPRLTFPPGRHLLISNDEFFGLLQTVPELQDFFAVTVREDHLMLTSDRLTACLILANRFQVAAMGPYQFKRQLDPTEATLDFIDRVYQKLRQSLAFEPTDSQELHAAFAGYELGEIRGDDPDLFDRFGDAGIDVRWMFRNFFHIGSDQQLKMDPARKRTDWVGELDGGQETISGQLIMKVADLP